MCVFICLPVVDFNARNGNVIARILRYTVSALTRVFKSFLGQQLDFIVSLILCPACIRLKLCLN